MAIDQKLGGGGAVWTDSLPSVTAGSGSEMVPITRIIARGFIAAHGAMVGALFLFLFYSPSQILAAVAQGLQRTIATAPGEVNTKAQMALSLAIAVSTVVLALAVFGLFPLVQGMILVLIRDRLEAAPEPAAQPDRYGLTFYTRLLGNQGLLLLAMLGVWLPMMAIIMFLLMRQLNSLASSVDDTDPQAISRLLSWQPLMFAGIAIVSLLVSAMWVVFWLACCIVVSENERVLASWWKALAFCRQNLVAVLAMWGLIVAVGLMISPLGLGGQLGIIKEWWANVVVAVVYSAVMGYFGVLVAGLTMSLYLARRMATHGREDSPHS